MPSVEEFSVLLRRNRFRSRIDILHYKKGLSSYLKRNDLLDVPGPYVLLRARYPTCSDTLLLIGIFSPVLNNTYGMRRCVRADSSTYGCWSRNEDHIYACELAEETRELVPRDATSGAYETSLSTSFCRFKPYRARQFRRTVNMAPRIEISDQLLVQARDALLHLTRDRSLVDPPLSHLVR